MKGVVKACSVKFFDPVRGFGFVTSDNGEEAFLHRSVLERAGHSDLSPGQTVECEIVQGERSPLVTRLVRIGNEPTPQREPADTWDRFHRPLPSRRPPVRHQEPPKLLLTHAGKFATGRISAINTLRGFAFVDVDGEGSAFMPPPVLSALPPELRQTGAELEVVFMFGERGLMIVAARTRNDGNMVPPPPHPRLTSGKGKPTIWRWQARSMRSGSDGFRAGSLSGYGALALVQAVCRRR